MEKEDRLPPRRPSARNRRRRRRRAGLTRAAALAMGRAVVPVLEAMGIQCIRVERDDELDQAIDSTISASYVAGQGVALILTQKFLGAKAF